jgi:hypothetical protein
VNFSEKIKGNGGGMILNYCNLVNSWEPWQIPINTQIFKWLAPLSPFCRVQATPISVIL